jgi:hypothetical protein
MALHKKGKRPTPEYLQTVDSEGRPLDSRTEQLLAGRRRKFKTDKLSGAREPGSLHSQKRHRNPKEG